MGIRGLGSKPKSLLVKKRVIHSRFRLSNVGGTKDPYLCALAGNNWTQHAKLIRLGARILVRGGASGVLTPRAGPEPKIWLKMGAFPLKFPENCRILKKSWGQRGLGPKGNILWWQ